MPLRRLKGCVLLCEIMSAWSFLEVFLISILIAVMQLELLAHGLLNSVKNAAGTKAFIMINDVIQMMKDIGLVSSNDAAIFELEADLLSGAYTLLLAAAILGCAGIFINGQAVLLLNNKKQFAKSELRSTQ